MVPFSYKESYKSGAYQKGMSTLNLMLLLAAGGFVVTCALKLIPVYIEGWQVKSALESLASEPERGGLTRDRVKDILVKKFQVNQVDVVDLRKMAFERTASAIIVEINYEKRVPLMFNVDAVVKFEDNRVELPL